LSSNEIEVETTSHGLPFATILAGISLPSFSCLGVWSHLTHLKNWQEYLVNTWSVQKVSSLRRFQQIGKLSN
jgi:hypothetical protein